MTRISRWVAQFWAFAGAVSIRTKILGLAVGLVLLAGVSNTLLTRRVLIENMQAQLRDQSVSVARDLAARAAEPILLNNLLALQDLLLETQSNNPSFQYAFIVDPQGQILAHTFNGGFPLALIEVNAAGSDEHHHTVLLATNEGTVYDTAVPILDGKLGVARVGLSTAAVQNALARVTFQAVVSTLIILLIGFLVASLLTHILTRPIVELVQATRHVARGDYSLAVRPWAKDELGSLAQAFNQMTGDLKQMQELRAEREHLQQLLLERVIAAQEEERRRIARELHDSTSQSLTSLLVGLRTLEADCSTIDQRKLGELRQIAAQTLEEVHHLAMQLRPRALDDLGLSAALERLVFEWQSRLHIPIDLMITPGAQRLPPPIETALYRIIQEALTNIARHASAQSASILVERRQNTVIAVIEDNGIGFDPLNHSNHQRIGILGMQERAKQLGGQLKIESSQGHGTSIFVEIPVDDHETEFKREETHSAGG
ncbi:HAMP domain-containing protein [Bellilinea sp.]|uniref:histidine kinase n=1 Tax=Bellilinea caldifistulae TaxID=360411 RepID=A0A7C4PYL7_9CHLR|nr:HAMP domain-containing protein [Bellilinea sp.]